ncbi:hypothetical protein G5C60_13880 [Streptomyces sp. HC44]|uniref:Uncharacterized protein n=1 Tax=Streptomyces scabichelini TaxID=2711217 RepID=A0A6G4V479_9ACTN|nr:hypothetical protein [Streptomyces scabichelini]NGO08670.1 hypothetical protein [Streptomyces scabichelini]
MRGERGLLRVGVAQQRDPGRRQRLDKQPCVVGWEVVHVVDDDRDGCAVVGQSAVHGPKDVDAGPARQAHGVGPAQVPGSNLPGQRTGHHRGRHLAGIEVGDRERAPGGGVRRPVWIPGPGEARYQPHALLARQLRFAAMRPVDVGNQGKGLQLLDELLVQGGQFTGMEGSPMGSGTRVLDAGSQLPHQRLRSQGPERDLGG